jgi:hypothetical protein
MSWDQSPSWIDSDHLTRILDEDDRKMRLQTGEDIIIARSEYESLKKTKKRKMQKTTSKAVTRRPR